MDVWMNSSSPRLATKIPAPDESEAVRRISAVKPEETYQCQTMNCGCLYDPDRGDRKGKIPKGTRFESLPDEWKCPVCGASRKMFRPLRGPGSVIEEK